MEKVRSFTVSGQTLSRMPRDQRTLLVQLSQLHNTIQLVRRWILAVDLSQSGPLLHASLAQQGLATRTMCGVLHEGWNTLTASFFATKLSRNMEPELGSQGQAALRVLKTTFSGDNAITHVRNKFAFHSDREQIETASAAVGAEARLHMHVSEHLGNSLYYLSEEVIGAALLRSVEPFVTNVQVELRELPSDVDGDLQWAVSVLARFQKVTLDVAGAFDQLNAEVLGMLIVQHVPPEEYTSTLEAELPSAIDVSALNLPFFLKRGIEGA